MSKESISLYERIGGSAAVDGLVDEFYGRVLNDPTLRPFFERTAIDRLKRIQKEFFAAALDGPVSVSDVDLARIHNGMGIQRRHVTAFVEHLINVLETSSNVSRTDCMDIVYRISTYSDQIIDGAGGEDG